MSTQRVLLTRPEGQGQVMMAHLEQGGWQVVNQPLIRIEAFTQDNDEAFHKLKQRILDFDQYDIVISVSSNAAQLAEQWLDEYWPQLPAQQAWFAVGPSSAQPLHPLLEANGRSVTLPQGNHSEGLLALPALHDVRDKKVIILRGQGGRELIKQTLEARGAHVDYAELYARKAIDLGPNALHTLLTTQQIHYALVTSAEMVEQFDQNLEQSPLRQTLTLLVPSERIKSVAIALGFTHTHVCQPIDGPTVLSCLRELSLRAKGINGE